VSPISIVIVIVAIAVVAIGFYMFSRRGGPVGVTVSTLPASSYAPPPAPGEAVIVGDVIPIDANEPFAEAAISAMGAAAAPHHATIHWARRFEPRDGAFDDATRLSLIRDLGIVRAPWGVPLLTQAYEEEPAVEHRRAALRALAAYRHPDTQTTFEAALRSDDEESRAIAGTALSALQIRASLTS
jgi:hypothetical protein